MTTGSVDGAVWFEAVCRDYLPRVRSFFVAALGPTDPRVDDLTSATFESLCKLAAADKIDRSRDLWPLVAVVARRRLADDRRTTLRRRFHSDTPVDFDARVDPATDSIELVVDLRDSVQTCLRKLPPAYREALVLHGVYDASHPEIVTITGRTPGAVRVLLTKARQRFRAHYEGDLAAAGLVSHRLSRVRRWLVQTRARFEGVALAADAVFLSGRLPLDAVAATAVAVLLIGSAGTKPAAPEPAPLVLVAGTSLPLALPIVGRAVERELKALDAGGDTAPQAADDRQSGRRVAVVTETPAPGLVAEPRGHGTVDTDARGAFLQVAADTPVGPVERRMETGQHQRGEVAGVPRRQVDLAGAGRAGLGC